MYMDMCMYMLCMCMYDVSTCLSHPSIVSQPGDRPGAIVLATFENALARLPTLAVL